MNLEQINFLDYSNYTFLEIIYTYLNTKISKHMKLLLIDIEILIEDFICFFKLDKTIFGLKLNYKNNNLFVEISNDYTYRYVNNSIISIVRKSKIKYLVNF